MKSQLNQKSTYSFLVLFFVGFISLSAYGISELNQFDKAPDFVLSKLTSPTQTVSLQNCNKPAILIFGEPYNAQTLEALKDIKNIYKDMHLTEADLPVFLIFSQTPTQEQIAQIQEKDRISTEILMDQNRKAFGTYGVIVLPSTVLIDKEGKIAIALSGKPYSFVNVIGDAILFATGHITRQQYESSRSVAQNTTAESESVKHARLLTALGEQLLQRNYSELALEQFREALKSDMNSTEARTGMAKCFIKLNLLPSASEQLEKVLQVDPNQIDANLILAQVEIMQGEEGIKVAKEKLRWILTLNPNQPKANYIMGNICELQGQTEDALKYYKKAASLLLEIGKI